MVRGRKTRKFDRKVPEQTETGASLGDWTGPVCVGGGAVGGGGGSTFQPRPGRRREPGVCVTSSEDNSFCPEATVTAVKVPEPSSEALLISTYICYALAFLSCRPSSQS